MCILWLQQKLHEEADAADGTAAADPGAQPGALARQQNKKDEQEDEGESAEEGSSDEVHCQQADTS